MSDEKIGHSYGISRDIIEDLTEEVLDGHEIENDCRFLCLDSTQYNISSKDVADGCVRFKLDERYYYNTGDTLVHRNGFNYYVFQADENKKAGLDDCFFVKARRLS